MIKNEVKSNNKLIEKYKVVANILPISLNDYPSHVSTLIYFQGCNLKCGYCFNYSLIPLKYDGFSVKYVLDSIKTNSLIDSVSITGGEPLLHFDVLKIFLEEVKKIGLKTKLDTNGTFPEKIKILLEKELIDAVAIDIKGDLTIYKSFGGNIDLFNNLIKTIDILNNFSVKNREFEVFFRSTLIKNFHSFDIIKTINSLIPDKQNWYIQSYLNDNVNRVDFNKYSSFNKNEIKNIINKIVNLNSGIKRINKVYYDFDCIME